MPSENVGEERKITCPLEDRGWNRANTHGPHCAKWQEVLALTGWRARDVGGVSSIDDYSRAVMPSGTGGSGFVEDGLNIAELSREISI